MEGEERDTGGEGRGAEGEGSWNGGSWAGGQMEENGEKLEK